MSQLHREPGGRRLPALPVAVAAVVTALGLGLAACGVAGQVPDPPVPTASSSAAASTAAVTSEAPTEPAPPDAAISAPATAPGAAAGAETTPSAEAPATSYPAVGASPPVEVRLPAIGVSSPLHALGLAADGTLEVPTGALVDQAAWYSGSPTPGEVGPTVVEGHVTGPGGRPSVFFELGATVEGDRVEVDREDGRTVVYEVYRVDQFAKDAFPTVDVYGSTPGPELRVITCGGEFDEVSGHHVDNTVVFARQVSTEG